MKDYKKILEGIVNIVNTTEKSDIGFANICTYIGENCPELAESDDERIRKEILNYIDKATGCKRWVAWLEKQGESIDKITQRTRTEKQRVLLTEKNGEANIDWDTRSIQDVKLLLEYGLDYIKKLENQGEQKASYTTIVEIGDSGINALVKIELPTDGKQKPADKVEPKFKVGDWCIDNEDGTIFQIVKVLDNTYNYRTNEGKEYSCTHYSLELDSRFWTISDAKDGDVLAYLIDEEDLWIMIYRSLYKPYEGHVHYHALLVNDEFSDKGTCCICIDNLKPATKEQRDLLFQKMNNACFTFDFEKKKLKKIEQKSATMSLDEAIEHCKEKSCGNNACALEHKQLEKWLTELKELKEQEVIDLWQSKYAKRKRY